MKLGWVLLALALGKTAMAFDHTHAVWDKWLKEYATAVGAVTTVNYRAAKEKRQALDAYTKEIEGVSKEEFSRFTPNEQLALLINAYNAFTVKLIVDNYPVKSIKDLGSLFSSPWKKKFFKLFGEDQHLDGIEHGIIRERFNEPRIHFAVVCASKGCPQLRTEAWIAGKLEGQFEAAANAFLKDTSRNRYDAKEGKLYLSKIFDWYGKDFVKKHGSVQNFVAPRVAASPTEEAAIKKAELSYLDYDWSLNESVRAAAGS